MAEILNEWEYLIHLVRCAIHDLQPRELPEKLSFERVYEWGQYHHIANIAFHSVEKLARKPEPELYRKWENSRDLAILRDINQIFAAQELRDEFRNAGIRFLEVQGTKIKPLYPQSDWRTMSDIDFIIDTQNIPKAKEIVRNLGYAFEDKSDIEINGRRLPNVNLEVHTDYFEEYNEYHRVMHDPFSWMDEQGECEPDGFYLYNILHIAKHYFYGGCGIRRVLDVYYLNRSFGPKLDQDRVQNLLRQVNAADFAAEFGALANAWFSEEEERFPRSEMVDCIISAGLHGSVDIVMDRQMEKTIDTTVRFAKLRYLLGRFFGSREELRIRYPILERWWILYPVCWLCRGLAVLKPKNLRRIRREARSVQKVKATDK